MSGGERGGWERAVIRAADRPVLALLAAGRRRRRRRELLALGVRIEALEPTRTGALARGRKLAAGAVLVAAAATGGTALGYVQGHEAGELEAAGPSAPADLGGLPGTMEDLCRARAEVAAAEAVRDEGGGDRDGGLSSLIVGAAEAEECRAEQQARVARLLTERTP